VLFLLVTLIDCVVTAGACVAHILMLVAAKKDVYVAANTGTIAVLVVAGLMSFPVASLFFYHVSLMRKGKTTREDFKINEAKSPFLRPDGCRQVMCGPEFRSASGAVDEGVVIQLEDDALETSDEAALLV
jgi:hypothetical protein